MRSTLQAAYDVDLKNRSDKVQLAAVGKFVEYDDLTEATHELVRLWRQLERMLALQRRGGDTPYHQSESPLVTRCARAAHSALAALMNIVLPSSRGMEIRTLEEPLAAAPPPAEKRNVLVGPATDGSFVMSFDYFKNYKTLGRQQVQLPVNKDLTDALHAVLYTYRTVLVGRNKHRFVFMGPSGKPYNSSGAWTAALNAVFAAPLAMVAPVANGVITPRVGVNVMRKSTVTKKLPACQTPAERANRSQRQCAMDCGLRVTTTTVQPRVSALPPQ